MKTMIVIICVFLSSIFANVVFALPATSQPASKINLNTADVNALSHSIKGIGAKRAAAIVEYRKAHGVFRSLNDLALVHGLGKTFFNSHEQQLRAIFVL